MIENHVSLLPMTPMTTGPGELNEQQLIPAVGRVSNLAASHRNQDRPDSSAGPTTANCILSSPPAHSISLSLSLSLSLAPSPPRPLALADLLSSWSSLYIGGLSHP